MADMKFIRAMCESPPTFDLASRNQKNQTVLDFSIERKHREAVNYFVTKHAKYFNRFQLQAAKQFLEQVELQPVTIHHREEKPRLDADRVIASSLELRKS